MIKNKKFIILFVLIILAVVLGVFLFNFKKEKKEFIEYKENNVGFGLKIPNEWEGKFRVEESVVNDIRNIDYFYTKSKKDFLLFSLMIYPEKKWESLTDAKALRGKKKINTINGNVIAMEISGNKPDFNEKDLNEYNKLKQDIENIAGRLFLTGEYRYRTVNVYFSPANNSDCSQTIAQQRVLDHRGDYERGALQELLGGPTPEEKDQGFSSFFSKETGEDLKGFKIVDGVAYVNFNDFRQKISSASTSCGGQQLIAQIENTLKQFPSIKRVVMAISGQPKIFYEWLQLACPSENDCSEINFQTIN